LWAGAGTFAHASTATAGLSVNSSPGHLVVITSEEECAFLSAQSLTKGFIGASDRAEEGVFRWITGPEIGSIVSQTFWNSAGPDNSATCGDCVEFKDKWSDVDCEIARSWLIESECQPNNLKIITYPCMHIFLSYFL
jgi:hypothetical protein